jgi:hypothetical protein
MAYLPKNQYQQYYTNGDEYRLITESTPYTGNYIITSAGKVFAGTSPQTILGRLVSINRNYNNIDNSNSNNRTYTALKQRLAAKQSSYITIPSDQPTPTATEYAQGFFIRYLAVRLNTKGYFEISKDTYENFSKRNYNRDLYKTFSVPWSLKENNEEENLKTLRYYDTKVPGIFNFFPNKKQYAYKRGVINITPSSRIYPTGEVIPKGLPAAYQIGNDKINTVNNSNVPKNQHCGNCVFNQNGQCTRWNAQINKKYWCAAWGQLGSE